MQREERKIKISRSIQWKSYNSRILNNSVKLSENFHTMSKGKINQVNKDLNKPSKDSLNICLTTFSFISTKSKRNSKIKNSKA